MKMGTAIFWGAVVIIAGILIMLRAFGINIPIFKFLIGGLLIFWGIKILAGGSNFFKCGAIKEKNSVIFGEARFDTNDISNEYNVVFGKGEIDLTNIVLNSTKQVKINTVFGAADVKLPKHVPFKIRANSAFAQTVLPNENSTAFGTNFYATKDFNENEPYLEIESNVVFGQIDYSKK
ncbi:MAG: LiaF domain-containing protein [Bacteroidales bacterium]